MMIPFYIYFFLQLVFSDQLWAAASSNPTSTHQTDIEQIEYYFDSTRSQDLESVSSQDTPWKIADKSDMNLGYSSAHLWVKFTLKSKLSDHSLHFLELTYPLHDEVSIYLPQSNGVYEEIQVGDLFDFSHRELKVTRFVVPIDIDEVLWSPIYMRYSSESSLRVHMKLLTTTGVLERASQESALYFLFYGIMFAMVIYNLLLYLSIGDRSYLYYVIYIASHTLFQMALTGHFFHYILPDFPQIAAKSIPIFVGLASIGVGLFTRNFLESLRHMPRIDVFIRTIIISGACLIGLSLVVSYRYCIILANILPIYFSIICFIAGISRAMDGYTPARIYLIAFSAFFVGVIVSSAQTLGIAGNNFFIEHAAQIGATIECVLLSIGLGSKINLERKIRYKVQEEALRLMRENTHYNDQISKMLFPHQMLQIRSGRKLEETMPSGTGTACVLAFDVIGSSTIMSEKFSEMMERYLAKCRSICMDAYDAESLNSRGYMIKEMGDGFLCSVGFPFAAIHPSKALAAYELALEFFQAFDTFRRELDSPVPIHCCIGIASGNLTSYFTRSGSIRYDVWGHAIVLATRYEGIRKELFRHLQMPPTSLLIIQEPIYLSLPQELRRRFQECPLDPNTLFVRDDESATCLYFLEPYALRTEQETDTSSQIKRIAG